MLKLLSSSAVIVAAYEIGNLSDLSKEHGLSLGSEDELHRATGGILPAEGGPAPSRFAGSGFLAGANIGLTGKTDGTLSLPGQDALSFSDPLVFPGTMAGATAKDNSFMSRGIQANTVDADRIRSTNIVSGQIGVHNLNAHAIGVNKLAVHNMNAGHTNAGHITAATIHNGHMTNNGMTAHDIVAGTIKNGNMKVGNLRAGHIVAGSMTNSRVNAGSIRAGSISNGVYKSHALNAGVLRAGTTTAGRLVNNVHVSERTKANDVVANRMNTGTIHVGSIVAGL